MIKSKKIIYIGAALFLAAVMVIRLLNNKEATEKRVYQYDPQKPVHVHSIILKPENVMNDISYPGTFEPDKETKISAEIQGKVNAVLVDAGSMVRKGDAVIQLDNSLLKLQRQGVDIQIEGFEADVKRYTILAEADAIQGIQLDKTLLALEAAKVQRATLDEQIRKTTIVAPFGGIVTARLTEAGAFAAPGVPLLQITDIATLKFTIHVPDHELKQFQPDQVYSLVADTYPETELSGKVILTGSKANPGNSFPVQFSVPNTTDMRIKAGMFGKVIMKNQTDEKSIIIPASAIIGSNIEPQVYVVKNGRATLRDVGISVRYKNKALVSSGLHEGDTLITNGFINLFEGANILTN